MTLLQKLKEFMKDLQDFFVAKRRTKDPQRELITLDELKKELDIVL